MAVVLVLLGSVHGSLPVEAVSQERIVIRLFPQPAAELNVVDMSQQGRQGLLLVEDSEHEDSLIFHRKVGSGQVLSHLPADQHGDLLASEVHLLHDELGDQLVARLVLIVVGAVLGDEPPQPLDFSSSSSFTGC